MEGEEKKGKRWKEEGEGEGKEEEREGEGEEEKEGEGEEKKNREGGKREKVRNDMMDEKEIYIPITPHSLISSHLSNLIILVLKLNYYARIRDSAIL